MSLEDAPACGIRHPIIRSWFCGKFGQPTRAQAESWPLIAEGRNVLVLAPTGSGKTLAAFLVAISRFVEGVYDPEELCVLYVSPLKALNEDIRRNLLEPLSSLAGRFAGEGLPFPEIRVDTRSGDTPQAQRRRFLARPPAILALTPESLAILLLNPRARALLAKARYVVMDEVHAVLGSKRGAFLACQIARLSLLAGEFQRVALSATVSPPEAAAFFVGGVEALRGGGFRKRPVSVVAPPVEKRVDFTVAFPSLRGDGAAPSEFSPSERYAAVIEAIAGAMGRSRSVLVFTGSRRRAERIAFLLNERFGKTLAFAHHGALSKELRRSVETRLAEGRLPCVVATGSLELGIDIGEIDEVVLAGCPEKVSQAVQRIGRSGHGVGQTSRGLLLPFHGLDLLAGAALASALRDREIEDSAIQENPLDVLAQIILALCAEAPRDADSLYGTLKGFAPFHRLPRASYDRVVRMLAGSHDARRLRDIKARLYFEAETGELSAPPGLRALLYASGGVIANRGSYSLRLGDGTKIGELDEEFVWERRLGDTFSFGTRSWRIAAIGAEAVEVVPLDKNAAYIPFWKAEDTFRSPVLSRRILAALGAWAGGARPALDAAWEGESVFPGLTEEAGRELCAFLERQKNAQAGVPLSGPDSIAVEITAAPSKQGDLACVILHTFRGGAVNYPLAMALAQYLEETLGFRLQAVPDDNAVLLLLPRFAGGSPETIIRGAIEALGDARTRQKCFRGRLESSGVFGAAFREAAETALLIPRAGFGKRTPLWITRQRAKRLFDVVSGWKDFPLVAEAWRGCLAGRFDVAGFEDLLDAIREGRIRLDFFATASPSPFARDVAWKQTNRFMYEYDERPELRGASLSDEVIQEALGAEGRRPVLAGALVRDFCSKLRRELPGWVPEDPLGLAEWVKERGAIPLDEWETLVQAAPDGLRAAWEKDRGLGGRLKELQAGNAGLPVIVHRENAGLWLREPLSLLSLWLRREGPVGVSRIAGVFGLGLPEARAAVEDLAEEQELVLNVKVEDPEGGSRGDLVCDRRNLELLLRLSRKAARSQAPARPLGRLVLFLARRQNILTRGDRPWQALAGFSAPARLWESEFFPARSSGLPGGGYDPKILDAELEAGNLVWYGSGRERCGFCCPEDLDLVLPGRNRPSRFSQCGGICDFWQLKEACGLGIQACIGAVWEEAWKGGLSSTSWEPVRRGIAAGFVPREAAAGEGAPFPDQAMPRRRIPRALRGRWKTGLPLCGRWFSLAPDAPEDAFYDPLDEEELERARVRLLARRWGVLCRPLLEREEPALSWGKLLPAIRRLELAGELAAGRFFEGIPSLQFAPPGIDAELEACDTGRPVYWMNACDPASPAGLSAEGLDPRLPPRLPANRLCFRGEQLAAVSRRGGKDLSLFLPPDDPQLPGALAGFAPPRRGAQRLAVESINGTAAAASPYAELLKCMGFMAERKKLILWQPP
ncbi:MAG: DEAD/DEAH box helicase [Spirochaetia bacterium]|jgi:ATP-dependent Lhr-like helicase|nr:DEAD/DEAH box helicase [Spirochaetia bacterium]